MKTVTCIIPAYNEGKRVRAVLTVASASPLVTEIIVINDASTDDTKLVIEEFIKSNTKIKFIDHVHNRGKTASLYDALKISSGEYVFFLDSDLLGLSADAITELITPVINNLADVSLSLRRNSPRLWHWLGIDYISGERVLPKSIILPNLEDLLKLKPFGFEVFLNGLIIKNKCRVKIVNWPNVDSPYKVTKSGFFKGIWGDFIMILDILKSTHFVGPIFQIIKLRNLRVK